MGIPVEMELGKSLVLAMERDPCNRNDCQNLEAWDIDSSEAGMAHEANALRYLAVAEDIQSNLDSTATKDCFLANRD